MFALLLANVTEGEASLVELVAAVPKENDRGAAAGVAVVEDVEGKLVLAEDTVDLVVVSALAAGTES